MNLSCRAFCQSCSLRSRRSPPGAAPALFTRMPLRPKCLTVASTIFCTSASRVRSPATANPPPPVVLLSSVAAASSSARVRAQMATFARSSASPRATALPMPLLPPVTSATLPCNPRSMLAEAKQSTSDCQRRASPRNGRWRRISPCRARERRSPMSRVVTSSKLQDSYTDALPASRALFERARRLFPDAVTHDVRRMQPFPLYVERADGALKWDVDGRRYVDYWMGHGALLLGHNPRPFVDAVRERALHGTHYG